MEMGNEMDIKKLHTKIERSQEAIVQFHKLLKSSDIEISSSGIDLDYGYLIDDLTIGIIQKLKIAQSDYNFALVSDCVVENTLLSDIIFDADPIEVFDIELLDQVENERDAMNISFQETK